MNLPNLHIPAGKQRGSISTTSANGQSPQVRPPVLQGQSPGDVANATGGGGPDPSLVQLMIEQGIPVHQAAQVLARQQQLAAASASLGVGMGLGGIPTFPQGSQAQGQAQAQAQAQAQVAGMGGMQGIPGMGGVGGIGQQMGVMGQQQRNITPAMLIAQYSHEIPPRPPPLRPELILPDAPPPADRTGSLLARASASYTPVGSSSNVNAQGQTQTGSISASASAFGSGSQTQAQIQDEARDMRSTLFKPLNGMETGTKLVGRGTLGWNRVVRELVDDWPEGLREVVDEEAEDEEDGSGVMGDEGGHKGRVSGMPGQRKRKVQELAEEVDKALRIPKDSETVRFVFLLIPIPRRLSVYMCNC